MLVVLFGLPLLINLNWLPHNQIWHPLVCTCLAISSKLEPHFVLVLVLLTGGFRKNKLYLGCGLANFINADLGILCWGIVIIR